MSTNRLFYLLIVVFLMVTACAPQAPITSTPPSTPAATEMLSTTPATEASPAAEAPPQEFKGHSSDVWSVAFSPDGKYLATGSNDKTARLWDVATGEEITVFSGHTAEVGGVAFSPDGKYLLTGSVDTTARLWDLATGETVQTFSGHTSGVDVGGFSSDGKYMVTAGAFDLTGRVWDVASGETLHILTGHTDLVIRAAYSPDGKYVLTASVDQTGRLWDPATGQEIKTFMIPSGIESIAFSPDSKHIAFGTSDFQVQIWDITTGQIVKTFSGHEGFLQGVDFSPDGLFLLSGSADKTARLWDLATGQTLRVFDGHRSGVQTVKFSPDGNLIATASNDTVARVWDLQASPVVPDTSDAITLRLAVADQGGRPSEPYVLEFIEQVKTLSNGNLIIEPIWDAAPDATDGPEAGVIQLVLEGQADLGLAGSRAFDLEGITSFQALQAPFLIDNDALSKAVATSDISTQMLDNLSGSGAVGLTLWPEDLRHPFSVMPDKSILAPQDFAGLTIRAAPSDITYSLLETLGATPMLGDLDYQGAESGLRQGFSLTGTLTATGNVTFFAKYQVMFANSTAFEKLSEEQRALLREAAAATQAKAIAEHPSEADAAASWCAEIGSIVMASMEQIAAFESAAQPIFDMIAQDPKNAELIESIRELKAKTEPAPGAEACTP